MDAFETKNLNFFLLISNMFSASSIRKILLDM